jgi:hypothetical protein
MIIVVLPNYDFMNLVMRFKRQKYYDPVSIINVMPFISTTSLFSYFSPFIYI